MSVMGTYEAQFGCNKCQSLQGTQAILDNPSQCNLYIQTTSN